MVHVPGAERTKLWVDPLLSGGTILPYRIVGRFPAKDLALVQDNREQA